jgi:hypothetical protein
MRHGLNTAAGMACLAGVAFVLTAGVACPQDDPGNSKQKAKRVDVLVKVSTKDGRPLPPRSMVEISGQDPDCGSLNSNDAKATLDDKGEAIFRDLPACSVAVKINLSQYLPVRKIIDLRSCTAATPAKEHGDPSGSPCWPVSLLLELQ